MLQPDFKTFSRLAREATLVPVVKSVSADLLTPVSAFLAISQKESHAFLLESVERGEQIGRYTFLGVRPYMRVKAHEGKVEIERGRRREVVEENIFAVVKRLLREHQPATFPGLPPFTAGAVGYFAYDVVRQLERIGDHAKDDLALPDAELMFFDRLLAFDHLRHQIHIVAAADVSRESPRRAYDRALRDIAALERKLASGLSPALWRKSSRTKGGKLKVHVGTQRKNFLRGVERCKEYIAAGDIFQVVLSQRLDFVPDVPPFDLYRALRQVNPSPYLYFLRTGDTHILGSSPEMLVRVTGNKLEYRPIAGTHPRGRDESGLYFRCDRRRDGLIGSIALLGAYFVIFWRGLRLYCDDARRLRTLPGVRLRLAGHGAGVLQYERRAGADANQGHPPAIVSYGGSAVICTLITFGLLLSVSDRATT